MNRKILAAGGTAIAAGSLALAAFGPTVAGAQSTTTQPPASSAPAKPRQTLDDLLKTLVSDGTLTQAQADAVKTRLEAARPQGGHRGHKHGAPLEEVATFLGTTVEDLRTQLSGGKTIAQVAGDKTSALINSLVASANKRIDDAVAAGKMNAEQATQLKADTQQRVTDMVNGVKPAEGRRGPGRGPAAQAPSN